MRRALLTVALALLAPVASAQDRTQMEAQFRGWLEQVVWTRAEAEGIRRETFDSALGDVTLEWNLPGIVWPGDAPQPQRQAEFGSPGGYFERGDMAGTGAIGRDLMARHAADLARIEERFGVPPHILVAIWGRESGFGRVSIPHDAFEVLATKAYMTPSVDWFTGEVVAALQILQEGLSPGGEVRSSWGGALGQPQMMPSSYLTYAADGDGDGQVDIWGSAADSLASIASFLAEHGWVRGRDWGFEISLPESVSCALEGIDLGRSIADWEALGISRISGRPFPEHERVEVGYLLMPAGREGPAFLVTPNFYALKSYNRSDLYALYVGNLGDRIGWSVGGFTGDWGPVGGLYRSDIAAMQRGLEGLGYDVGGADGLPGFRTRRSIGAWQESRGERATCFPDEGIVAALKMD